MGSPIVYTTNRPRSVSPEMPRIEFGLGNRTPSWKTYGGGFARVEFEAHKAAGWLNIDATERCPQSAKRVMMTLDKEQAKALRDFLNENLP